MLNLTKAHMTRLYTLSDRLQVEEAAARSWYNNLAPYFHGGQDVYRLALDVRKVETLVDTDILPTFFTDEALECLLTMPNRYWFWVIVKEALLRYDFSEEHNAAVDVEAVQHAIRARRRSLGILFDLTREIDDLNIDETAYWVASGVIVLDGLKRVRNPIFSKPASV